MRIERREKKRRRKLKATWGKWDKKRGKGERG